MVTVYQLNQPIGKQYLSTKSTYRKAVLQIPRLTAALRLVELYVANPVRLLDFVVFCISRGLKIESN